MKRRRFITFGLVLAMVLSLGTVVYFAWFLLLHVRYEPVDLPWGRTEMWLDWKSGTDSVQVTASQERLIRVLWRFIRQCKLCSERHAVGVGCDGEVFWEVHYLSKWVEPVHWGPVTYASFEYGGRDFTQFFLFPSWLPIPVLAVFPLVYFAWRFYCRRRPGHCVQCDYDLTGNESGVCPECGTAVYGEYKN